MRARHYFSPKMPDPEIPALAGRRTAAAFRHVVGTAMRRAAKGLLALASHAIGSDTIRPFAAEDSKSTQCAGQWIGPRQPLVLPMTSRLVIACDAGIVWITQGDGNDYVLKAREESVFQPADKVIITAMGGRAFVRHGQQALPLLQVPERSVFSKYI